MTSDEIRNLVCNIALDAMEEHGDNKTEVYRKTGVDQYIIFRMINGEHISIYKMEDALRKLGYEIEIKKR